MKQFSSSFYRLKPLASVLTVAVVSTFASTFSLGAYAANTSAATPISTDVETRALDEKKAALINTPEAPAITFNAPRIDSRLLALMPADQKKSMPAGSSVVLQKSIAHAGGTLSAGPESITQRDGMVRVEIIAKGDGTAMQAELAAMGMKNMSANGHNISGDLPIASIAKLAVSSNLRTLNPETRPIKRSGSVLSQGDPAQRSDIARRTYGVNGKGVKIGVLSDSYNYLKGEAAGVASGDLPGVGNPNGFVTPVKVLKDFGSPEEPAEDEGRAMAEIIHDVAPGATMSFYTAFDGRQDFAKGIIALADDGAKIIVDDVGYFNEPWFQDGVVAQAVKTVTQRGVTYFSAAGNAGAASYESAYSPAPGVTKLKLISGEEVGDYELHTFRANGQPALFQRLTVAAGQQSVIRLQWDEPFASASPSSPGAASDLDVFFLAREGDFSSVVGGSVVNNLGGDAYTAAAVTFNGDAGTTADVYLVIGRPIKRVIGDPVDPRAGKPRFLKTLLDDFVGVDASFNRRSTIFGQSNAADAVSVCAVDYRKATSPNGPVVENFSSLGGTTILFTPEGRRTFEPRFKPDLCAPNRGNTTFFFNGIDFEGDGKPNFPGTSASAPHAAAVGALMLQASKNRLSPFFVTNLLRFTTIDMDDPGTTQFDRGFDFRTGFGFINAESAVQRASLFGY